MDFRRRKNILWIFIIYTLFIINKSHCIISNNINSFCLFVTPCSNKIYRINSILNNPVKIATKRNNNVNIADLINETLFLAHNNQSTYNLSHIFNKKNLILASIAVNDNQISNSTKAILLSGIYAIRIFKCMLYSRYLLEWLPQANPYLPPFCTIYTATNNFIGFFQKIFPTIMGFDFSGFIAWAFLENIEFLLLHIIANY